LIELRPTRIVCDQFYLPQHPVTLAYLAEPEGPHLD
jgi:hypothetical protein